MENNAYSAQQAARPEYLIVSQWLQAFRVVVSDFAKQELMACIRREIEQAERRAEAMRGDAGKYKNLWLALDRVDELEKSCAALSRATKRRAKSRI